MSILWLDTMAMPIEIAKHVDKKAIAGGGESYVFFRRPIWLGSSSLPFSSPFDLQLSSPSQRSPANWPLTLSPQ